MREMKGFNELRGQSRMTWSEQEHGWVAAPEEIVDALANDGFEQCKRELTTSRRDSQPAGGLWQGVDTRTGSVASAIWVNRPPWHHALVFIEVDGESLTEGEGVSGATEPVRATRERDPYQDEGGEA
jgi:hypothetical protein